MTDIFCRLPRRYFSDRLDGQPVPFFVRPFVRLHLTVCPQCKRFNAALTATRDALGGLRDRDTDDNRDR